MATSDNPLSAFFEGFQGGRDRARTRQQQEVANQLNEQLRQIQLMNAQAQMARAPLELELLRAQARQASRTPAQILQEDLLKEMGLSEAKKGALVLADPALGPVAEAFPIGQTAAQLREAEAAFNAAQTPATLSNLIGQQAAPPLGETAGIPATDELAQAMSAIFSRAQPPTQPEAPQIPLAPRPQFIPPSARAPEMQTLIPGTNIAISPAARRDALIPKTHRLGNTLYREDPETGGLIEIAKGSEDLQLKKILQPDGQFHQAWVNKQGNVIRDLGAVPDTGGSSTSGGGAGGLKPTGEVTEKFTQTINILGQIDDSLSLIKEFKDTGKFPGVSDTGVNIFLAQRPQDIPGAGVIPGLSSFYGMIQQNVREAQTPETRAVQMRKAMIGSAIIRTQAGLSQTLGEIINVAPYTPSESDTYESLVDKLTLLRAEGARALKTYQRVYPSFRDTPLPEIEQPGGSNPQVPTKTGSEVTQDGKTYRFNGSDWLEIK